MNLYHEKLDDISIVAFIERACSFGHSGRAPPDVLYAAPSAGDPPAGRVRNPPSPHPCARGGVARSLWHPPDIDSIRSTAHDAHASLEAAAASQIPSPAPRNAQALLRRSMEGPVRILESKVQKAVETGEDVSQMCDICE